MPESPHRRLLRPNDNERNLLRAALLGGPDALHAWDQWSSAVDLDRIDAASYRLLPLLYRNLSLHGADHPLMMKLRGIYRYAWYRNQLLAQRTSLTLRSLDEAGIQPLLIEGAPLTVLYEKDPGLRPTTDFDVMVAEAQVPKAARVLEESGWKPRPSRSDPIPFADASGFTVNVHRHAVPECPDRELDGALREGAVPVETNGVPALALGAADALAQICAKYGLSSRTAASLRWLADAVIVLKGRPAIDWGRLLVVTRKGRLVLPVRETLAYLREELEAAVPPGVLKALGDSPVTAGERLEYRARTCAGEERGLLLLFWIHWSAHSRLQRSAGLFRRLLGFPRYLAPVWGLGHTWQIPSRAMCKLMRKIG